MKGLEQIKADEEALVRQRRDQLTDIHPNRDYEVTIKLRVRFVDRSDAHGECLHLQAETSERGFVSVLDRRMWVDANEVAYIKELP